MRRAKRFAYPKNSSLNGWITTSAPAERFGKARCEPPLDGWTGLRDRWFRDCGCCQAHSETGPTLWTVLSSAVGGIKVPPPTKNEYVGEPAAQTTLYIVVVGTDGYETVVSEAEIDPGFGNAPPSSSPTPKMACCSRRCRTAPPRSKARPSSSCRWIPMAAVMPTRSAGSK
jgi:hypothetical protein